MTPLAWSWALFVWGYAPVWFLVTDRVKLLATAAPLLAKGPVDVTPQIAKRLMNSASDKAASRRPRGSGLAEGGAGYSRKCDPK
jgi:hypothetical protein